MTDRIILELKNNLFVKSKSHEEIKNSNFLKENNEINLIIQDIDLTLQSLNYSNKDIKKLIPILVNEIKNKKNIILEKEKISFEYILKLAMNHLDNNSNLVP